MLSPVTVGCCPFHGTMFGLQYIGHYEHISSALE
jgi:hypothetical protein